MGSARRSSLALVILLAVTSTAHAEGIRFGAMASARVTDIAGQVPSDPDLRFAAAALVEQPLAPLLALAAEPGIAQAGSSKYPLLYLSLPLVARMRWAVSARSRVRATLGPRVSYLATAKMKVNDDDGPVYEDARNHFRAWDLAALVGLGVERGDYFVDVRYARSLVTIHTDDPALFAVNHELGLWIGLAR